MQIPDPVALTAQERAMDGWWARSAAADDSPPIASVLIGYGTEDIVIPPGNAELLAARFPGARVELFAGAGHAVPAQLPDTVADLVASQLQV